MLYGRTLFGAALYPRQVTAGGIASASASVSAQQLVHREATGVACFGNAAIEPTGVRNVLPVPGTSTGVCSVASAKAVAEFRPPVATHGAAAVAGTATCDFFGTADSSTLARPTAWVQRTARTLPASKAVARATIEPDAAVYVLADPEPIRAKATVFGTHWFVGRGEATPNALPAADGQIQIPASGTAPASGSPVAAAAIDCLVAGVCRAQVEIDSDPLIESGGIEYWSARGVAIGAVSPSADPYVFTVALAVGRGKPSGEANAHRAAKGKAVAHARGAGDMQRVVPESAQVVVGAKASAAASASRSTVGTVVVDAVGAFQARATVHAFTKAHASGAATGRLFQTEVRIVGSVGATASVAVDACRLRPASGAVAVLSSSAARGRYRAVGAGTSVCPASGVADGIFHPKILVSGLAEAVALANGTNRVNESTQPLSSRVVTVGSDSRQILVNPSPRLVAVGGYSRQMAA